MTTSEPAEASVTPLRRGPGTDATSGPPGPDATGRGAVASPPPADRSAVAAPDDAFTTFYREQSPQLVRVATLIVGSRALAEELVQEAFVAVHARWDRIVVPEAYARRAVVNACRSHLRRRVLERRHLAAARVEVAELEARELLDALARLPLRQRTALVLRFYADLSERDTAAAMGCPPGTVGSLVHRGLATLRQEIER